MESDVTTMTDLEFCDHYIERCRHFVNPVLLREASQRNLVKFLNYLPGDIDEAKAVLRARFAKAGKFFGDEEIDKISGEIDRIEQLRVELNSLNVADAHKVMPILTKMLAHTEFVKDYFKTVKIP